MLVEGYVLRKSLVGMCRLMGLRSIEEEDTFHPEERNTP
jgi:hypothetical protein